MDVFRPKPWNLVVLPLIVLHILDLYTLHFWHFSPIRYFESLCDPAVQYHSWLNCIGCYCLRANLLYIRIFMVFGFVLALNQFRASMIAWISAWRTVDWFGRRREMSIAWSSIQRPCLFLPPNSEASVKQQFPCGILASYSLFREPLFGNSVSHSVTNFLSGVLSEIV